MDFQLGLIVAGLTVRFIVGLTRVGGGSLMTPILLIFFQFSLVALVLLLLCTINFFVVEEFSLLFLGIIFFICLTGVFFFGSFVDGNSFC